MNEVVPTLTYYSKSKFKDISKKAEEIMKSIKEKVIYDLFERNYDSHNFLFESSNITSEYVEENDIHQLISQITSKCVDDVDEILKCMKESSEFVNPFNFNKKTILITPLSQTEFMTLFQNLISNECFSLDKNLKEVLPNYDIPLDEVKAFKRKRICLKLFKILKKIVFLINIVTWT